MKTGKLLIVTCMIIYSSCSSGKKIKEYVVKIDSLSLAFESKAKVYQSIDTILLLANLREMERQFDKLDTVAINSLSALNAYSKVRQSYNLFLVENRVVLNEIEFSKKQVQDLKFDIQNNLVSNSEAQKYISQEMTAINDLSQKMGLYHKEIKQQMHNFELNYPIIEHLIDSLAKN